MDLKYQITVFKKDGENVAQLPSMYYDTVAEAFASAIISLKVLVRDGDGDIFLLEKDPEDNVTIVKEITEENLVVRIRPNILSPGTDKIGPYCASSKMWLGNIGEA